MIFHNGGDTYRTHLNEKLKMNNKKKQSILNLNSREKFEPGPGFEPRTPRSLAWRSTT